MLIATEWFARPDIKNPSKPILRKLQNYCRVTP